MKSISFIIPIYNEEERLGNTFQALENLVLPHGLILKEIIFVNDGSKDNSISNIKYQKSKIEKKTKATVTIISYKHNMGKGYAIKQGMLKSTSDYSLFFDADMSTPLSELAKINFLIEAGKDVVIGTRKNGKSTVINHQPKYREYLGKSFTYIAQLIFKMKVTDFTCGFKVFSKKAKNIIFAKTVVNKWAFDVEALFLAEKHGLKIYEIPLVWTDNNGTKVKLYKDIPETVLDLIRILLVYRLNFSLAPQESPGWKKKTKKTAIPSSPKPYF